MREYTKVFTEGGTVVHDLDPLLSPNDRVAHALCGRSAWPGYWHGTGTQDEIEKAMDLKPCSSCKAIRNHREGRIGAS